MPECIRDIGYPDNYKSHCLVEFHQLGFCMQVQGFVSSAFFDKLLHDPAGKSPVPVFFEHVHPVNLTPVRMAGTTGYTDKLCTGGCGKEPIICQIGFLVQVMDPEFLFSTAHFVYW